MGTQQRSWCKYANSASASGLNVAPMTGTKDYMWRREAEKKHARVALLAAPSLAIIAVATGDDPCMWLNSQPLSTQLPFYGTAALLEILNLRRIDEGFTLKDGEVPGRLLPIKSDISTLETIEDNLGRLAMIGVASILTSSLLQHIQ